MAFAARQLLVAPPSVLSRGISTMEEVMSRTDQRNTGATRVEVDQRSRDTRLRLEQVERLLVAQNRQGSSWFGRVLYWLGFGIGGDERRQARATQAGAPRARAAGRRTRGTRVPIEPGTAARGMHASVPQPAAAAASEVAVQSLGEGDRSHGDRSPAARPALAGFHRGPDSGAERRRARSEIGRRRAHRSSRRLVAPSTWLTAPCRTAGVNRTRPAAAG